ncbi:MAG: hypothetical protein MHMPM18_001027 [Marteilia pararefringens]
MAEANQQMSHEEKLEFRAKRFGEITSEKLLKQKRSERFLTNLERIKQSNDNEALVSNLKEGACPNLTVDQYEKLNKRAERFGFKSDTLSNISNEEMKKKRAERFIQN